jgi:hypothetical protein
VSLDLLQQLMAAGMVPATTFPPTSRYAGIGVALHQPDGDRDPVPYLRRRLCPSPEHFATLQVVTVVEGDRRDTLAARHLGDPELWWRLADANGVIDPRLLTRIAGATVRVTLAAGVPEPSDG